MVEEYVFGSEKCKYFLSDCAAQYCKILNISKEDYPHKFRWVFCFGNKNSLECKLAKKKFGLKTDL